MPTRFPRRSTRRCSSSGSGTGTTPLSSPARRPRRLPLASASWIAEITELDVGSPFDYEALDARPPLLRCPPARSCATGYVDLTDELGDLIEAAGG